MRNMVTRESLDDLRLALLKNIRGIHTELDDCIASFLSKPDNIGVSNASDKFDELRRLMYDLCYVRDRLNQMKQQNQEE